MKKTISVVLIAVILICSLAGCADNKKDGETTAENSAELLCFNDIYAKEYIDIFRYHKLTVVNLFATWCGPCINELPELQALNDKLISENIAVVGIVTDAVENGEVQLDIVEKAKTIAENAGVTYPLLLPPDDAFFTDHINNMQAFPETLFIDKNGNIIESAVGARSLAEWSEIVEKVVEKLEE